MNRYGRREWLSFWGTVGLLKAGNSTLGQSHGCFAWAGGGFLVEKRVAVGGRKSVAVLGSSTAAGAIAGRYSDSWAGRLTIELASSGIDVTNVSIGGTSTSDSITRFTSVVSPLRPSAVILANSILNGPFLGRPQEAAMRYVEDTKELIRLTREVEAVPVLVGPIAYEGMTPSLFWELASLMESLASLECLTWDFLGASADGTGKWLSGLNADELHPNAVGHRHLFESIPLPQLTRVLTEGWSPESTSCDGIAGFLSGAGDASGSDLVCSVSSPLQSWTVSGVLVGAEADGMERSWRLHVDFGEACFIRIDTVSGEVFAVVDGRIEYEARFNFNSPRSCVVSYRAYEKAFSIFADGIWIVRFQISSLAPLRAFNVRCRSRQRQPGLVTLHTAPKFDRFASEAMMGRISRASLDSAIAFGVGFDGVSDSVSLYPGSCSCFVE